MPHFDARTGDVVIRVVYDGSPEAGKTTNVRALASQISLQRRGNASSPGTKGDRTEFFDWLDFAGGYLDGRRVRCQLVSVPGQSHLLHRRRYLLDSADAVVFVVDSRSVAFTDSASAFETTRALAARHSGSFPLGIVLQANKQDCPDALRTDEIARRLSVDPSVPVVAGSASSGDGVMQTFVLAVRLATERVRAMILGGSLATSGPVANTADDLHRAMESLDPGEIAPPMSLEDPTSATVSSPTDAEGPAPVDSIDPPDSPEMPDSPAETPAVTFPPSASVLSGHIWPPARGRTIYGAATAAPLLAKRTLRAWAPADAKEWCAEDGTTIHTTRRWAFDSETEARHHLVSTARRAAPDLAIQPEDRTFVVLEMEGRHGMYVLTPPVETVRMAIVEALGTGSIEPFDETVTRIVEASRRSGRADLLDLPTRGGAAALGFERDALVTLSLEAVDPSRPEERRSAIEDVVRLLERTTNPETRLRRWFESEALPRLRGAAGSARA